VFFGVLNIRSGEGNIADLKKHTGEAPQSDDITFLAVRYNGAA
jgi:hypothetical protein